LRFTNSTLEAELEALREALAAIQERHAQQLAKWVIIVSREPPEPC
jgi:hypothetical protein